MSNQSLARMAVRQFIVNLSVSIPRALKASFGEAVSTGESWGRKSKGGIVRLIEQRLCLIDSWRRFSLMRVTKRPVSAQENYTRYKSLDFVPPLCAKKKRSDKGQQKQSVG